MPPTSKSIRGHEWFGLKSFLARLFSQLLRGTDSRKSCIELFDVSHHLDQDLQHQVPDICTRLGSEKYETFKTNLKVEHETLLLDLFVVRKVV